MATGGPQSRGRRYPFQGERGTPGDGARTRRRGGAVAAALFAERPGGSGRARTSCTRRGANRRRGRREGHIPPHPAGRLNRAVGANDLIALLTGAGRAPRRSARVPRGYVAGGARRIGRGDEQLCLELVQLREVLGGADHRSRIAGTDRDSRPGVWLQSGASWVSQAMMAPGGPP